MPDPEIAALNQKIRTTLTFFGSGLRYEHDGAYKGRVYFKKNREEKLVYSLSLGYDGHELCVIGLNVENGYKNHTLCRALFSLGVEERNPLWD